MRYVTGPYTVLRAAVEEGEVGLHKVASADNKAGICTKPLTGAEFEHLRSLKEARAGPRRPGPRRRQSRRSRARAAG